MENRIILDRIGNLNRIINDLGERDQKEISELLLSVDYDSEQVKIIFHVFFNNFTNDELNKCLQLRTYRIEKYKSFNPEYEIGNNIKQLAWYDYASRHNEVSAAGVNAALTDVEIIEKKYNVPFWEFNKDQIKEFREYLLKDKKLNKSTVDNKLGYCRTLVRSINELLSKYNDKKIAIEDNWALHSNKWKPRKLQLITYNELMDNFMPKAESPENLIVLFLFKGMRLARETKDSEIARVKLKDFDGNELTVHGKYGDRVIKFTPKEMEWVNLGLKEVKAKDAGATSPQTDKYFIPVTQDSYLFRKLKFTSSVETPLGHWSLNMRLNEVWKNVYGEDSKVSANKLRISGILDIVNRRLIAKYGTLQPEHQSDVVTEIVEVFGEVGDYPEEKIKEAISSQKFANSIWHRGLMYYHDRENLMKVKQ
ncbi:hypothetical protein LR3_08725 [Limosilactobacillus reuteri]|uniref:Integrase n=1 Tax=Limosilactobacillus reuteri TaxID=1598 RepID=A0A073JNG1_LIMRT|nr:hypothetical protein LR3_08725 [Limosilactobacillus reuteri]